MIQPSEIVNNLVTALRAIPSLVTAMGELEDSIFAYSDQFPHNSSLHRAIHQMPLPSIMAVWMGTQPGRNGGMSFWQHRVTLYVRAGNATDAYASVFRLITKTVPTGYGNTLLYEQIHASCEAMDIPSIQRQTDAEGLDYFEIPLTFQEIGDD